ncbi:hypothetical protein [Actinomadura rupiterrae]|uniref:hypothetical protein n=1 Tax=Actinomadura rupiterrae TaxID=559627 RepID=UPI0020A5BE3F|nr:hypothetical protein [Actinomadura rupiterrae]MCP2341481.1 hypothetical protein [Actinomadura rupiterrae]
MPQQRRFVRLGSAATAVSATALVITAFGAPAASAEAASASAAKPCKKGTDPKSTVENWKCQLDNLRDRFDHHNTPSPTPTKSHDKDINRPGGDGTGGGGDKNGNGGGGDKAPNNGNGGPRTSVPSGNGPTLMDNQAPQPFPSGTPNGQQPNVPGLLPAPQVAGPGAQPVGSQPVPQTHLVSPVAASERTEGGQMLWVAGAAAVVGAAAALNLSHIGRQIRRRPGRR